MLSDEEDKLKKDQEETEKDKRDFETLPKSGSGAIETNEQTVDASLPDASIEAHPLPVDEGVDLSDDNIDQSPIAGKDLIHKIKEGAIIETKSGFIHAKSSHESSSEIISKAIISETESQSVSLSKQTLESSLVKYKVIHLRWQQERQQSVLVDN